MKHQRFTALPERATDRGRTDDRAFVETSTAGAHSDNYGSANQLAAQESGILPPIWRESGNELATEVRERLAAALVEVARDTPWVPGCGVGPDVWSDADLVAILADRCDQLIAQEERLKLRISALKRRARALGVRVEDAYARRSPFVLCSDALPPMYVYALVSTSAPLAYRYIGCTDSPHQRLSAHLSESAAKKVRDWVRETLRSGHLVQMVELWRGADRLEAEEMERQTIADYAALGLADLNVHGNTVAYAGHRRAIRRGAA